MLLRTDSDYLITIGSTFGETERVIIDAVDDSKERNCYRSWEWWRETIGWSVTLARVNFRQDAENLPDQEPATSAAAKAAGGTTPWEESATL